VQDWNKFFGPPSRRNWPASSSPCAGRAKSDVLDCQWLQCMHSYGLLTASFRPAEQVVVLRSYLR
jgi:hypothetical protein